MTGLNLLGGALLWADSATPPSEDALWLAASVPNLPPKTRVLDMACGNGAVGLALLARQPTLHLVGLDCDATVLAQAQANAALNQQNLQWQHTDAFTATHINPYPVVVCNPPFHRRAKGHSSPSVRKALAHGLDDLNTWVNAWQHALVQGGRLYCVLHSSLQAEVRHLLSPLGGTLWLAHLATHPTRAPKRLLACWHKTPTPFIAHTLNVVPSYHSPLRQAVLHRAGALAVYPEPC
jgi:tRNA1(Val) A37 N6-methylase TrmN6